MIAKSKSTYLFRNVNNRRLIVYFEIWSKVCFNYLNMSVVILYSIKDLWDGSEVRSSILHSLGCQQIAKVLGATKSFIIALSQESIDQLCYKKLCHPTDSNFSLQKLRGFTLFVNAYMMLVWQLTIDSLECINSYDVRFRKHFDPVQLHHTNKILWFDNE